MKNPSQPFLWSLSPFVLIWIKGIDLCALLKLYYVHGFIFAEFLQRFRGKFLLLDPAHLTLSVRLVAVYPGFIVVLLEFLQGIRSQILTIVVEVVLNLNVYFNDPLAAVLRRSVLL